MELAHRGSVVHGVEGRDLVHTHRGHLQYARNLVHDADAGESVLSLSKIEEWHDGGLLVLRGVPGDDLLDELLILGGELEGNRGVVLRRVTVLAAVSAVQLTLEGHRGGTHHHEAVAPRRPGDAECAPLGALELAQSARSLAAYKGNQLRGHGGVCCGLTAEASQGLSKMSQEAVEPPRSVHASPNQHRATCNRSTSTPTRHGEDAVKTTWRGPLQDCFNCHASQKGVHRSLRSYAPQSQRPSTPSAAALTLISNSGIDAQPPTSEHEYSKKLHCLDWYGFASACCGVVWC